MSVYFRSNDESLQIIPSFSKLNCNQCISFHLPGFDAADSSSWPTHLTDAAIDLTLRRKDTGQLMHIGGIFDDASAVSHTSYFEKKLEPSLSASNFEARKNRRLLYWAMTAEGFANYPYEWWHYDWGNQMWSKSSGQSQGAAWYGPAKLKKD